MRRSWAHILVPFVQTILLVLLILPVAREDGDTFPRARQFLDGDFIFMFCLFFIVSAVTFAVRELSRRLA